jgi:hypothetical protein
MIQVALFCLLFVCICLLCFFRARAYFIIGLGTGKQEQNKKNLIELLSVTYLQL